MTYTKRVEGLNTHPDHIVYGPRLDEEHEELLHLRPSSFRGQISLDCLYAIRISQCRDQHWVSNTYQALYAIRRVAKTSSCTETIPTRPSRSGGSRTTSQRRPCWSCRCNRTVPLSAGTDSACPQFEPQIKACMSGRANGRNSRRRRVPSVASTENPQIALTMRFFAQITHARYHTIASPSKTCRRRPSQVS